MEGILEHFFRVLGTKIINGPVVCNFSCGGENRDRYTS